MYLELNHLSKRYDNVVAIDDVSLSIAQGEFVTFLGPSGSGKSTILRMIAGFTRSDSGYIKLNGELIQEKLPYKRNLGIVFQDYSLFPHMTVQQNVAFGLRMRKVSKEEQARRVADALETVRLSGYEKRLPNQLSGGQRQRVALARAIVIEPLVLLLDEPLGALDRKLREEMQIELRRIHEALGVTTIFVTHDQEEALTMSDRVAILSGGQLHQMGTPYEVYERPATDFVADFLGRANLLQLAVVACEDSLIKAKLPGGSLISVPAIGEVATQDDIQVLVRPEHISFYPPAGDTPCNTVECAVERISYHGSGAYAILNGPGDVQLIAYISARELAEHGEAHQGQRITVYWPISASTILSRRA